MTLSSFEDICETETWAINVSNSGFHLHEHQYSQSATFERKQIELLKETQKHLYSSKMGRENPPLGYIMLKGECCLLTKESVVAVSGI